MAASHLIRVALANLHEYMKEMGNDITQFNEHVRMHLNALSACGEKTSEFDLLHNLFEAYLVCPDTRFKAYMTDLQIIITEALIGYYSTLKSNCRYDMRL